MTSKITPDCLQNNSDFPSRFLVEQGDLSYEKDAKDLLCEMVSGQQVSKLFLKPFEVCVPLSVRYLAFLSFDIDTQSFVE